MEMGASSASFPADCGEIWAPILSDPLDWSLYYATVLPPSQIDDKLSSAYEDDAMEIQQLLEGARDEKDLDEWLEGAFDPSAYLWDSTHQMEGEFYSPTTGDGMTGQTLADPKINLLDFIQKDSWRHAVGARGPHRRRASPWNQLRSEIIPLASGGRINNDRWTLDEVKILLKGIKKYGVGQWTKVKRDYFSPSVRTAVNIKDKWRNLLRACGVKSSSKKKEKAQITMLQPLGSKLMKRIRKLAVKHPYPKIKHT